MIFTDDIISDLIACPKKITVAPKKSTAMRGSDKTKFEMESIDGNHSFSGFISVNQKFPESFSIGLVYYPKDEKGSYVLLRANGPHGPNESVPHHDGPHIHIATAERIAAGLKPEGKIETDVSYSVIVDAIQAYCKRVNIIAKDRQKHFPLPDNQIDITFGEGDDSNG